MNNLIKLKNAFEAIFNAKGNAKIDVIRSECVDDYVKRGLLMTVDPRITFGFGIASLLKESVDPAEDVYTDLLEMCHAFSRIRHLSNLDISHAKAFLQKIQDSSLREFAEAFVSQSISLGASVKTINKAFGEEVIPQFCCMLASKYTDCPDVVSGHQFYLTEKLDGIRCIAQCIDDVPVLMSRQGHLIEGLLDIESDLKHFFADHGSNIILDGELIVADRDRYTSKDQYKRTTKIVRSDGVKRGIVFHVFDFLRDINDKSSYRERRLRLARCVRGMRWVTLVPVLYHGDDESEIAYHLDQQRALNREGIMINLADKPYEFKRTKSLLKCKVMQDCDLRIIGFQKGTGRLADTLGAIVVDYKGNEVGVGSGFSDTEREYIWSNRYQLMGRIATIRYFEETNDADGNVSLRFPVFVEIREQDKEVSYH